jgi:tetratricopeptide (TPR) repeat protein
MELDSSLAEAHLAAAEVDFYLDWDFRAAESEFKRTIDLNSNYVTGHQWYGEFLALMGREQEAERELDAAKALDPLSPVIRLQAGNTFDQFRQYDRALEEYREALRMDPNFKGTVQEQIYWVYRREGRYAESAEAILAAHPYGLLGDEGPRARAAAVGTAYSREGKVGYLRASIEYRRHWGRSEMYLARDYADLGDKKQALYCLEKAYNRRDLETFWINFDPEFDSLRSDAGFQELVRKLGLPSHN